jgi:putative pyruvate formate lyase activating enzyme
VSAHFHHPGEELVYRGLDGSGTIFFTSCNMRCAFCPNGDISTDKNNGVLTDARTLATMAWLLRVEGCHNVNWVGGDPTIHLHTIVAAIALLGEGFTPSPEDVNRAFATKSDRMHWFDRSPDAAIYDGAFNVSMLWNSNFFMTPETIKILRLLIDVWLPDFKFGPGRCAMSIAKTLRYRETVTGNLARHPRRRKFHHPAPGHVESRQMPYWRCDPRFLTALSTPARVGQPLLAVTFAAADGR